VTVNLDDKIPGCDNFYWREFLWLNSWGVYVYPTPKVVENIKHLAKIMEVIRLTLGGHAITITSGWRPIIYNVYIGGAIFSMHVEGRACDWIHSKYSPDECRAKLESKLRTFGIRMEDKPGSSWVHVDTGQVKHKRYFKP